YFERAIRLDPDYAAAYAGLADAWGDRGVFGGVSFQEVEANSRANALKALQLDEKLSEAHSSLGYVKAFYNWDWAGSEKEYRRALDLDPNSLQGYFGHATLLMCLGRFPEAISQIERAQERDPLSATVQSQFGRVLYRARRYKDAIAHFERALELDPQ